MSAVWERAVISVVLSSRFERRRGDRYARSSRAELPKSAPARRWPPASRQQRGATAQPRYQLFAAPALSDDCSIESLSPVAGPTSGGTHVNVTRTDLGDGPTWECSFGSAVEAAEYSDPEDHVECNSPEAAAGAVAFGVRMGGTPCAQSLSYEFYAPPNVSGISPASGSLQGGTTVTVTGSGFDAMGAAHCAFGSLTVDEKMAARSAG